MTMNKLKKQSKKWMEKIAKAENLKSTKQNQWKIDLRKEISTEAAEAEGVMVGVEASSIEGKVLLFIFI